jgi:very-short-patch-repair endonuclease
MENLRRSREAGGVDAAIAELARLQHGVVAWWQMRELGLGKASIEHRIKAGRIHRLQPAVYAVGHRIVSRHGWWMAAVLSSGEGAALSHHSAAALWGLRGYSERAVDVTTSHKSTSSRRVRRHVSRLPADEITVEHGIPVTTVPRTILDLAATEPADAVQNLLREAEFHQLWDRLSLWDLIERYPGKRGVSRTQTALKRLKTEPEGRKRSRLEERFAPFLRQNRLALPRFNDWILLGDKRFQVDCHWPETRQIVELDGWDGHRTRTAFREDRARDRRLRAAGYSVTRLTWNQLEDEPEEIAADLHEILIA